MTIAERIAFCEKCTCREHTEEDWIVCSLTGKLPEFENQCPDFDLDEYEEKAIAEFRKEPKTSDKNPESIEKGIGSGFYIGLITLMGGLLYSIYTWHFLHRLSTSGILIIVIGGGAIMRDLLKSTLDKRDQED